MPTEIKRIVVCSHCNQQITPAGSIERLPLPEFRTDHSETCVCGACVYRRFKMREAEQRAGQWGVR